MRCLTKPLTAAMAIAVILVSGTAWAGVHGPQEVTISGYPRRAEGTLLGARSSPNTFQFIGCRVFAYPTGSRWTFCQADSGWSNARCRLGLFYCGGGIVAQSNDLRSLNDCHISGGGENRNLCGRDRHELTRDEAAIVRVDNDGNRHEETIEFDGNEPRAFLGVMTDSARGGGARISSVIDDTAADDAGLERGDVITGFDGQDVEDDWDLIKKMLTMRPGDRVEIEVLRDGNTEVFDVELGEREHHSYSFRFDDEGFDMGNFSEHMEQLQERLGEMDFNFNFDVPNFDMGQWRFFGHNKPKLGVELIEPTSELREHFGAPADAGVIVGRVMEDMPAEDGGLQVGDMIIGANGREIEHTSDLVHVLDKIDGETLELDVIRDGRQISLDVYIPAQGDLDDEPNGPRA